MMDETDAPDGVICCALVFFLLSQGKGSKVHMVAQGHHTGSDNMTTDQAHCMNKNTVSTCYDCDKMEADLRHCTSQGMTMQDFERHFMLCCRKRDLAKNALYDS